MTAVIFLPKAQQDFIVNIAIMAWLLNFPGKWDLPDNSGKNV